MENTENKPTIKTFNLIRYGWGWRTVVVEPLPEPKKDEQRSIFDWTIGKSLREGKPVEVPALKQRWVIAKR
jgi:hypothetical protein